MIKIIFNIVSAFLTNSIIQLTSNKFG
jgi:hypothetical protein